MLRSSRSNSVSSEDAPSSPESIIMDSSPEPSPAPHIESVFEEDHPSYSPAYRPDDKANFTSHYEYRAASPPSQSLNYPVDDPFGCQEDFVRAVQNGDPKNMKRILSRYSQLIQINRLTPDGQTALTQSCIDGNIEMVKVLVAFGANVDLTNRDGFSPLHVACFRGNMDLFNVLLQCSGPK